MTNDNNILGKLHTGREVIDYVSNNGILLSLIHISEPTRPY